MDVGVEDLVRAVLGVEPGVDAELDDAAGARGEECEGGGAGAALVGDDFGLATDDFEAALAVDVAGGEALVGVEGGFVWERFLSVESSDTEGSEDEDGCGLGTAVPYE